MYPTNQTGNFNIPEPPLEPPDCWEPEPPQPIYPKLFQPLEKYTLQEIKEYCEEWDDCPQDGKCAFYHFCGEWPRDWKLKERDC